MQVFNKKTLLLFAVGLLNYSLVNADANSETQAIDYQKEADKYKKLYEKYQKLADTTKNKSPTENSVTEIPAKSNATNKSSENSADKLSENSSETKSSSETGAQKNTSIPKEPEKENIISEPWDGTDFGIGATVATGDSATTNVNAMSNISYKPFKEWSNKAFLNYVYSSNDRPGERAVKVNKTQLRGETSWNFTKRNAAYGRMTYLNDELSSYDYILTESLGYKRRIFENDAETMNIELSAGPSFMQSKVTGKELQVNEPGFQATFDYVWNFSDKSNFKQNILYNYDPKNRSVYQSISALSVKLYKHFSLQLTFQLNGTTLATPGKKNINTITSTNIMYTF